MPHPLMPKELKFYDDLQDLLELIPPKVAVSLIRYCNAKEGSQQIPGVIGKFGLEAQNEVGQKYTLVIANTLFQQHKR